MDFFGKACPVCSEIFKEGDDIVVCPKCGAPYHRDCYKQKGKCIYPELHRDKKSWHDVYDSNEPVGEDDEEEKIKTVKCALCGFDNPPNAIMCAKCGSFLGKNKNGMPVNPFVTDDKEYSDNDEDANSPDFLFNAFLDPLGGVNKDENFDGITAAEAAKYVEVNTQYYIPTFKKIAQTGKSRFSFAAFVFGGGWFLYRKQYVKGIILSLLSGILTIGNFAVQLFYTNNIWRQATEALSATKSSYYSYVSYTDYFGYMFANYDFWQCILIFLPLIVNLVNWGIMIYSGVSANRSYYRHVVKKVKKIKAQNHDSKFSPEMLSEKGGVNMALALVFLLCYIILSISAMFV